MRNIFTFIFMSVLIYGNFPGYVPTTTIEHYDVNVTIHSSGALDIIERLEIIPRKIHKNIGVDNPIIVLDIPTMIKSKNAIRYIDSKIDNFSVLLNDKAVFYKKRIFHENEPSKLINLRLSSNYIMDVLTDEEKNSINNTSSIYIYTLAYKVKRSVVEDTNESLDAIIWKIVHSPSHIAVKHMNINIFLPSELTKNSIKNLDIKYKVKNKEKQISEWKDCHHFHVAINHIRNNDLSFQVSFPQGLLGQLAKDNFNLILDDTKGNKETKSYRWDRILLYWQFPFFIFYFMFLFYYARSYGSFGAIGSIAVRYKPADNMSLLQSALLLDKNADNDDLTAAIAELAGLGYLEIIDNGWGKPAILKQIRKDISPLSEDQKYLLKSVLFVGKDLYYLPSDKRDLYHKLEVLNTKLHDWVLEKEYIDEDFKKTRKRFLIKALLTSIPILLFSLYVTKDIYGERLMIGAIVGTYFLTGIIATILIKQSFLRALPFLLVIYFIIGVPFMLYGASSVTLLSNPMLVMPFVYAFIWFFYQKIGIYTGKGLQTYRNLLGYKEYLKRTEVPKLKYMLKEHPKQIETSLAYAMLFKMMSYPPLDSYKMDTEESKILREYRPRTATFLGMQVRSRGSMKGFFIFWSSGMILFFILNMYDTFFK